MVLGEEILEHRPLHRLFLFGAGDEDRFHRIGVKAGVEHAGGDGAGGRVEVLHLFGVHMVLLEEEGQLDRVLDGAARVGRHQVRDKVLLFADRFGRGVKPFGELPVDLDMGLAHAVEDVRAAMFGGDLQLAGDVVRDQFVEEAVVLPREDVVVADARADKDLFDAGERPQFPQNLHILGVVDLQRRAGGRGEAFLPALAEPLGELFTAGGAAEVGGRAADVVDIPLKTGEGGQELRLFED